MLDNSPISKKQKLAAAGLAVFAMLIIVLWFAQLRKNIYGPFLGGGGQDESVSADNQALANEQAQKNKDTDGDGLSDWDELNVYKTSPYLADTDGDSLPDGQEVKDGADPNCPKGRTCVDSAFPATTAPALLAPDSGLNNLSGQNGALNNLLNQFNAANSNSGGNASLNNEQVETLKNINAASLRQLLLQNGMQKEVLDKISDADLMKSYGEVLQP
ncbi:MAG: hypothetical protein Q7R92_00650 [bacterium]|nr:hypothetical protein [bacterium]